MKNVKGQSLFEVVIAISVITLIIVAMVILATTSIRNNSYSRNKTLASRYNQEAIEWLRSQRDQDWTVFRGRVAASPSYYCLTTLSWTFTSGLCGDSGYIGGTIFKRQLTLTVEDPSGNNYVRAEIGVSWADAQGEHISEAVTYFSDWNK